MPDGASWHRDLLSLAEERHRLCHEWKLAFAKDILTCRMMRRTLLRTEGMNHDNPYGYPGAEIALLYSG